MSFVEKRQYTRRPYVQPIRYFVMIPKLGDFEKNYSDGVSVDISEGGLKMITDYPLERGNILFFDSDIKINNSTVNSALVRWSLENNKRYMVGMKFIR